MMRVQTRLARHFILRVPSLSACTFQSHGTACKAMAGANMACLEVGRRLAAARAKEYRRSDALFSDPLASMLSQPLVPEEARNGASLAQDRESAMDIIATRYIDDTISKAVDATSLNNIRSGDYRQVVLIGDALDSRPYRLPWPAGTLLFLVARSEAHAAALEALGSQSRPNRAALPPARVPRACLLRRVDAALNGEDFLGDLERAGFQPGRLSVWVIQGLDWLHDDTAALRGVLACVGLGTAYHSLAVGELPTGQPGEAEQLLAEAGLLSAETEFGSKEADYGRWQPQWSGPGVRRRLFAAQQQRLSTAQENLLAAHSAAAMEADEDFFGNFS